MVDGGGEEVHGWMMYDGPSTTRSTHYTSHSVLFLMQPHGTAHVSDRLAKCDPGEGARAVIQRRMDLGKTNGGTVA